MINLNRRINFEYNQSRIRLNIVIIITVYLYIMSYYSNQLISDFNRNIIILFYIISIIELLISSVYFNTEKINALRVIFRIITNILDNLLLGIAIISFGQIGIPFFIIYLWVTFGIGLRYGIRYLILSTILNIVSFSLVICFSNIWHSREMLPFSIGLLVSFVVLPCYVYILIAKLSEALDSEKKSNEIKQNIIAIINHELRTPLSSIFNITEMLKASKFDINYYKSLNMISVSTSTLLQLINNILDVSKIKSGGAKIENKKFNLYKLLYQIKNILEPQCAINNIKIYFFVDSICHPFVCGAIDQIKQILINLGSNATKFTNRGYVRLSVSVLRDGKRFQDILFEVSDTGIGIESNNLKKIFQPYKQANTNISSIYGGTGLGIYIANELAKEMDTEIIAESAIGDGSSFSFKVKVDKNENEYSNKVSKVNIYLYKLNNHILNKIREYVTYFSDDISVIKIHHLGDINNNGVISILMLETESFKYESEEIETILSNSEMAIVEIKNDNSQDSNIEYVTTTLCPNFTRSALKNAIQICTELNLDYMYEQIKTENVTNKKLKILFVEDDHIQVEINRMLLINNKYSVEIANTGYDALNLLKKKSFDLVIVDYYLSDMTGVEIVQRFKLNTNTKQTDFILITADKRNIDLKDHVRNLFLQIIEKPLCISQIEQCFQDKPINRLTYSRKNDDIACIDEDIVNYKFFDKYNNVIKKNEVTRIIDTYDKEVFNYMRKLYEDISNNEIGCLNEILHKLKGVSATIGADAFCKVVTDNLVNSKEITAFDIGLYNELYYLHIKTVNSFKEYISKIY